MWCIRIFSTFDYTVYNPQFVPYYRFSTEKQLEENQFLSVSSLQNHFIVDRKVYIKNIEKFLIPGKHKTTLREVKWLKFQIADQFFNMFVKLISSLKKLIFTDDQS